MTYSKHSWIQPGMIVRYENRSGTIIPQQWIFPARTRRQAVIEWTNPNHTIKMTTLKNRGETRGILKEGLYLVVAVHSGTVHVIVNGRVVELLCPIDLYPADQ